MWRRKHETTDEPGERVCRETLVVHADGTHECEGAAACGGEELLHDWWVPCDELRCGCVGEERGLELPLLLAA